MLHIGVTAGLDKARRMKRKPIDVLVIEDQQFDAELVLRALHIHAPELTAVVAETGAAAAEFLKTHSPKVILLDLHLPDMDGCELLRRIRQDPPCTKTPVIVLTGSVLDRDRKDAHGLGINAYINKTSDVAMLAEHLSLFKHLLNRTTTEQAEVS
jgi:CheY-like chemotaxis protein